MQKYGNNNGTMTNTSTSPDLTDAPEEEIQSEMLHNFEYGGTMGAHDDVIRPSPLAIALIVVGFSLAVGAALAVTCYFRCKRKRLQEAENVQFLLEEAAAAHLLPAASDSHSRSAESGQGSSQDPSLQMHVHRVSDKHTTLTVSAEPTVATISADSQKAAAVSAEAAIASAELQEIATVSIQQTTAVISAQPTTAGHSHMAHSLGADLDSIVEEAEASSSCDAPLQRTSSSQL